MVCCTGKSPLVEVLGSFASNLHENHMENTES